MSKCKSLIIVALLLLSVLTIPTMAETHKINNTNPIYLEDNVSLSDMSIKEKTPLRVEIENEQSNKTFLEIEKYELRNRSSLLPIYKDQKSEIMPFGDLFTPESKNIDGVIDDWNASELVAVGRDSGLKGANLDQLYLSWDDNYLYLALKTNNTESWYTTYGFAIDIDNTSEGYCGDRDAWNEKISFARGVDYEILFSWDKDMGITTAEILVWSYDHWEWIEFNSSNFAYTGNSTVGLQTLEVAIPWAALGGKPLMFSLIAWVSGGGETSAVDTLPVDPAIDYANIEAEWDDKDTLSNFVEFPVWNGSMLYIDEPLIISSGESRVIENTMIIFRTESYMEIQEGGELIIRDSIIRGYYPWQIRSHGNLEILNSELYSGGYLGWDGLIRLESNGARIINSTIASPKYTEMGVYIIDSEGHQITGNKILGNIHRGIFFDRGIDSVVQYNQIAISGWDGIELWDSEGIKILNNKIEVSPGGGAVLFLGSRSLTIADNDMVNGGIAIWDGSSPEEFDHVIENNTVNGKEIVYLKGASNLVFDNVTDIGEFIIFNSEDITIKNFNFYGLVTAITVAYSKDITILSNLFRDCTRPIRLLTDSENVIIEKNTFLNVENAVELARAVHVVLEDNYAETFWGGIRIWGEKPEYFDHIIENFTVNGKPILYLKNTNNLVLDNPNIYQLILFNVSDVTIKNIEWRGGDTRITIAYSEDVLLRNISLRGMADAPYIVGGTGIVVDSFRGTEWGGMRVEDSSVTIVNSTFDGYSLRGSGRVSVKESKFFNTELEIWWSRYNEITHNTFNRTIISLDSSGYNLIVGNLFDTARLRIWGVESESIENIIEGNIFIGNNDYEGALYISGDKNVIHNNEFSNNLRAIVFGWTRDNEIYNNIIMNNGYGIYFLGDSENNLIYNNIFNNTVNVYFESEPRTNLWNTTVGNYWSDYNGTDANGDGIGDTPYVINENNVDYRPLMKPEFRDIVPPTIIIHSPIGYYNTSQVLINYTVTDNVEVDSVWYELYREDTKIAEKETAPQHEELIVLPDGIYTLMVYANDTNGNLAKATSMFVISHGQIPLVCPQGCPFTSIQDAIDNSPDYSTILVLPGRYEERVTIDKPVKIIGLEINGERPVITWNEGNIVTINSEDVKIEGFVIEDPGDSWYWKMYGIRINANNVTIENNIIRRLRNEGYHARGIIAETDDNPLSNINIKNNLLDGWMIYLRRVENSEVSENKINLKWWSGYGIELDFGCEYVSVVNNTIEGTGHIDGVRVWGGEEVATDVIEGNTVNGKPVIFIKNRNGETFEFDNTGNVIIANSSNLVILESEITGTYKPITIHGSHNITLLGNYLHDNSEGIWIFYSENIGLYENNIQSYDASIYLWDSRHVKMRNNNITSELIIDGNSLEEWNTHDIDTTNFIDDKPILYLTNISDLVIDTQYGQIILANTKNVTIENQIFEKGERPIQLGYVEDIIIRNIVSEAYWWLRPAASRNITIEGSDLKYLIIEGWDAEGMVIRDNIIHDRFELYGGRKFLVENNTITAIDIDFVVENSIIRNNYIHKVTTDDWGRGIEIYNRGNIVENNTIEGYNEKAIYLRGSDNVIRNNIVKNNYYGIYVGERANDNLIYSNFFNNTVNAYVEENARNYWNSTIGNYWSDYTGVDANGDNIGDVPYIINDNNIDYKPLTTWPYKEVKPDVAIDVGNATLLVNTTKIVNVTLRYFSYRHYSNVTIKIGENMQFGKYTVRLLDISIIYNKALFTVTSENSTSKIVVINSNETKDIFGDNKIVIKLHEVFLTANETPAAIIEVWLNKDKVLGALQFNITFDPSVIHITNVTLGEAAQGTTLEVCNILNDQGIVRVGLISADGLQEGTIVKLTIKGIAPGLTQLTPIIEDISDIFGNQTTATTIPGTIRVYFRKKGDINMDGRITAVDALLYLRVAVGLDISPLYIDPEYDDTNEDGEITVTDALKILRVAIGADSLN